MIRNILRSDGSVKRFFVVLNIVLLFVTPKYSGLIAGSNQNREFYDYEKRNPNKNNRILYVASANPAMPSDQVIIDRLTCQGYSVTTVDDHLCRLSDAEGYGMVMVSSTVSSIVIGDMFKSIGIPFFTWEAELYDDMDMALNYGSEIMNNTITVVEPAHGAAGGQVGRTILSSELQKVSWGKPTLSASIVATMPADKERATVFAYEKGDALIRGNAAGKRIGICLSDYTALTMTQEGWDVFDGAVHWAFEGFDHYFELLIVVSGPQENEIASDLAQYQMTLVKAGIANKLITIDTAPSHKLDHCCETPEKLNEILASYKRLFDMQAMLFVGDDIFRSYKEISRNTDFINDQWSLKRSTGGTDQFNIHRNDTAEAYFLYSLKIGLSYQLYFIENGMNGRNFVGFTDAFIGSCSTNLFNENIF